MFLSDVYLSMTKPTYKLIVALLLSTDATGARFCRLSGRRGAVFADQLPVRTKFHRRPSSFHPPPPSSAAVSRRRLDPCADESSLDDELTSISSGGQSINGIWHIISDSLRGMHSCSSDRASCYHPTLFIHDAALLDHTIRENKLYDNYKIIQQIPNNSYTITYIRSFLLALSLLHCYFCFFYIFTARCS